MAICEKCIKKSVCKLCDGSEIMGCIEFVSKGKCVRASKGQELNCSEIPTGSTAKIDVSDNNVGNMDCILRSDAIKAIQKYGVGCLDPDDFSPEQCERFVINKLNELPSVTPEPKTGHWIEHPHEAGPNWEYSRYECSECHDWSEDDSDYCPNCGADMREVEE